MIGIGREADVALEDVVCRLWAETRGQTDTVLKAESRLTLPQRCTPQHGWQGLESLSG